MASSEGPLKECAEQSETDQDLHESVAVLRQVRSETLEATRHGSSVQLPPEGFPDVHQFRPSPLQPASCAYPRIATLDSRMRSHRPTGRIVHRQHPDENDFRFPAVTQQSEPRPSHGSISRFMRAPVVLNPVRSGRLNIPGTCDRDRRVPEPNG